MKQTLDPGSLGVSIMKLGWAGLGGGGGVESRVMQRREQNYGYGKKFGPRCVCLPACLFAWRD